jgi:hypothetical protein
MSVQDAQYRQKSELFFFYFFRRDVENSQVGSDYRVNAQIEPEVALPGGGSANRTAEPERRQEAMQ